jgi:diguanylate cyclase (GGDEF)-like protein/PAS domain S-box-containing protein
MDRHGLCTLINPTGLRLLGYRHASELLGRNIHYLIHHTHADGSPYPMEQCPIVQTLQDNQEVHLEDDVFWRADATSFAVEYHSHPILRNGRAVGAVVTFSDITERKAYQIRIAYLATHDALTELPNRTLFNDRTSYTLAAAHRTEQRVAVLFLDLDRFKVINDSLGHTVGDAVLRALSLRLKALMREGDTVARLGGDEFGILLVDIRRVEDVISIVRKLLDAFSKPLAVEGYELFVTVSIGASLYPDDGQDVDTLMTNADVALFRVKEQGRNAFQFYTQDMSLRAQQRLELETALRLALQRQEFELHYQPRVDLRNGTVSGVEALIRWQSRDRGWVPPNSIISIAEESGLILPLGEWVLRTACIQNKRWQEAGLSPMQVAVNVSARQFWQGDICDTVERVLKETGLNARDLELEVTESVIMRDVPEITQTLSHLKSSGLTISIDDFGTGYSSLSYLRRLPVDKLKIDQSFVHDIMSSPEAAGIVRELISLAHALHLSVTAEGVETEEEFGFLSSYGCDEVQGYYISHPLPPAGVQQLLQEANV